MNTVHIAYMIAGTDLPIVFNVLIQKNYLSNLIQSPIVHAIVRMGVCQMAQRVAMTSHNIAGRLALFHKNWECITTDPWVKDCIRGYSMQ